MHDEDHAQTPAQLDLSGSVSAPRRRGRPKGGRARRVMFKGTKSLSNPVSARRAPWNAMGPSDYDTEIARKWHPRPSPRPSCALSFSVKFCGCSAKLHPIGCGRVSCRTCQHKLRLRRAGRIKAKLDAVREGLPVVYLVFTLPWELRSAAAKASIWQGWRKRLMAFVRKALGVKYLHERTDPASSCAASKRSGDPCSCNTCTRWHPHMNVLGVVAGSKIDRSGRLTAAQLKGLKRAWASILGRSWTAPVDVYAANTAWDRGRKRRRDAAGEERELWRLCSYQGRTWPDWQGSVRAHMVPRWYGKKIKVDRESAAECKSCGEEWCFLECQEGAVGLEEAKAWLQLGPAECAIELAARLNDATGKIEYRPFPARLAARLRPGGAEEDAA